MSQDQADYKAFAGFETPKENYSKLPHGFVACLPRINSLAELKVVLYTLRHTWGFSEFGIPKKITTDEYMNGRKKSDRTRMDNGTGLSKNSVITGLELAVEHGFIVVEIDDSDKARIEKCYMLNMAVDVQNLHIGGQKVNSGVPKVEHRTEKETKERNSNKDIQEEEAKPNIFGIYESEVGILTPMIADALQEAENTYPAQWITDAIREAVKNNARNWKYIEAILKRWKAQGNQEGTKQKQNFIGKAIAKADEAVASVVDLATERLLSNGR